MGFASIKKILLCIALFFCWLPAKTTIGQAGPLIESLIWEAQTSVPGDYMGKALPSEGATVKVFIALAPGVSENDITANWTVDDRPTGTREALLLTFAATKTAGDRHRVSVRIKNQKTGSVDDATLLIPVVERELRVYTADQTSGILDTSDGHPSIVGGQNITFLVNAYFFPIGNLLYRWTVDGRDVTGTPRTPNALTLTTPPAPPEPIRTLIRASAEHTGYNGVIVNKDITLEIR